MGKHKFDKRKWKDTETTLLFGAKIENKFANLTLDDFGLYQEDNFLQQPKCRCGCECTTTLLLDTEQDVIDFCYTMAEINECDYCAVFALMKNGKTVFSVKYDGEISLFKSKSEFTSYREIGELFEEFDLCYFGLIVPDGDGYRVVEE